MTAPQTTGSAYPRVDGPSLEDSAPLQVLVDALQARFGDALQAVVLYGSCLRSADLLDGLVDLYALVDDYTHAEPSRWLRVGNRLLPPNVYYLEAPVGESRVRCKYAVLSLRHFEQGCSRSWFQSYIWGRFSQPVKVVYAYTPQLRERLHADFLLAGETLLRRAIPALPTEGPVDSLWEGALALSYATELRSERKGRAKELAEHSRVFYAAVTRALGPRLEGLLELEPGDGEMPRYRSHAGRFSRRVAPFAWGVRRVQGKSLSMARLIKGLFTFEGGLDYLAWKLTRHSGQEVVIPEKVRRRPLIHIWGLFWQLYRRGVFR